MIQLGDETTQLQGGAGKLHGSRLKIHSTDCLAEADADPLSGGDVAVSRWHLPAGIRNKHANSVLYELEQRRPQDHTCKAGRASAHVCNVDVAATHKYQCCSLGKDREVNNLSGPPRASSTPASARQPNRSSPCKSKGSTVSKARFTSGVTANAWWLQHRSVSTNCFICRHGDKPLGKVCSRPIAKLQGKDVRRSRCSVLCFFSRASQAALQPAQDPTCEASL